MYKISDNILSWCNKPEEGAVQQAVNISKHPCLIGNVCLMPDTHEGYGMPIGGVVALNDAICPNMVGVDIGCGMLATKTNLKEIDTDTLKTVLGRMRDYIPVGFNHQSVAQNIPISLQELANYTKIAASELESAKYQLGTLGGGNHFIEIQKDEEGFIWFMIHSGSRNIGYKVAKYYNEEAIKLARRWRHNDLIEQELCFFPRGEYLYDAYIDEMNFCLAFARCNRDAMASKVVQAFNETIKGVTFEQPINIHHNYATLENHYGTNVMVHRKGATLARKDTIGIIPGSQGTASYIVQGKGNEASLCSCSHGAGRLLSRKKACETLDLETERKLLEDKGILHSLRNAKDLEEAASAYKDIDEVMESQKDLVSIVHKLTPLAVMKG